eukprot:SAG31_NODE_4964_length_2833_cov_1.777981_1_plen_188_part_00
MAVYAGTGSDVSPYAWRSAGVSSKALVWGEAGWAKFSPSNPTNVGNLAELRLALAESERLAAVVLSGADFWNLSPVDADDAIWAAYQMHSVASNCGFVLAFRRIKSVIAKAIFPLMGLLPSTQYALSWSFNYTVAERRTASGATLLGTPMGVAAPSMTHEGLQGLHIELPSPGSSVLVEYSPVRSSM